jgi:hypothetical protein
VPTRVSYFRAPVAVAAVDPFVAALASVGTADLVGLGGQHPFASDAPMDTREIRANQGRLDASGEGRAGQLAFLRGLVARGLTGCSWSSTTPARPPRGNRFSVARRGLGRIENQRQRSPRD